MKLLTKTLTQQLIRNGHLLAAKGENLADLMPVVKLFTPDAPCTWLLSALDPNDPEITFGLYDLGSGRPELGSMRLSEIEAVRGRLGMPVERDFYFHPRKTLLAYADDAKRNGYITA